MATTVEKFKLAVLKSNLTVDQLWELATFLGQRAKTLERGLASRFYPGQRVSFMTKRENGMLVTGEILRINTNTCNVRPLTIGGSPAPPSYQRRGWRVAFSLLNTEV